MCRCSIYRLPWGWEQPGHSYLRVAAGIGRLYFGVEVRLEPGWLLPPYWTAALRAKVGSIHVYLGLWQIVYARTG